MDITVTKLEGNAATLTVTVPAETVDAAIAETYRSVGADRAFAGFRKGKAPRSVLDTNFGRQNILADASSTLAKDAAGKAIVAEQLLLIEEPALMLTAPVAEGEPYTFSAQLKLHPELTITGYDNIVVKVPPVMISDAEVDAAIEQFRDSLGTFEVASGEPVGPKDMIIASLTSEVEGIEGSQQSAQTQPYELGRGAMPPAFDEGLLGHSAGDTVHIEFVVPGSAASEEEEDKKAIFDVTIHEVRSKRLPELTGESVAMFGYADLAAMREQFTTRLQAERDRLYERARLLGARRELASRLEGDVPVSMVNARVSDSLQALARDLERHGMAFEQYCQRNNIEPQQLFTSMRQASEQELKETLALEALFRALGMELSEDRLAALLEEVAAGTGTTVEQQREAWDGPMRPMMRIAFEGRLAGDWLLEHIELETVDLSAPAAAPAEAETPAAE